MKKNILLLAVFFTGITVAQNESSGSIATSITTPGPISGETFRFGSGIMTQLDAGSGFGFTNDRWFSMGRLNTGSQSVYGLRFQLPNRAVTFGYQDLNDANPRIQWIGASNFAGSDLEFRVANSFTSTASTLVATMTNEGQTIFGTLPPFTLPNNPKVGINFASSSSATQTGLTISNNSFGAPSSTGARKGIYIENSASTGSKTGLDIRATGSGSVNTGVNATLSGSASEKNGFSSFIFVNSTGNNYGVKANLAYFLTTGPSGFGAAVQGSAPTVTNLFAGYFNGNVFTTGSYLPSDEKLKENIKEEENTLEKLSRLNTVTYNFKQIEELNLPKEQQHGFLAQNLEEVFPELITEVNKPIYDKDEKQTGIYTYKAVNYNGMISILTSSLQQLNEESKATIQELTAKIDALESQLVALKDDKDTNASTGLQNTNSTDLGFSMEQNKPNPFTNQTVVNYTLPRNTKATISVVDLSGKFIKDYTISDEKGQLTINSSEIGKGIFVYALIADNEVIITKKMIIR
jgi:hypothetical protein